MGCLRGKRMRRFAEGAVMGYIVGRREVLAKNVTLPSLAFIPLS